MLVTKCPRCGKPTSASLATPDRIACEWCGYAGAPSDDAKPILKAARDHLDAQDFRKRQIDDGKQRALKRSDDLFFAAIFAICSLPCTAVVVGVIHRLVSPGGQRPSAAAAVTSFVAFGVMCFLGAGGFLAVRRAQRRLRAACAAIPPARLGDSAKCRVCGGDLAAGGAIVRCRFCGTDNWANTSSIRSMEKREAADAASFEHALAVEVSATKDVAAGATKLAPVFAVLVPLGFLILLDQMTPLLQHVELSLDDTVRYTSAMTRDGECIGHPVVGESGSYVFEFGVRTEFPGNLGKSAPPTFSATTLVGRDMRAYVSATEEITGRVERVFGSPVGNLAMVNGTRVDVRGLCDQTPKVSLLLKGVTTFVVDDDILFWPEEGRIASSRMNEAKVITVVETKARAVAIATSQEEVFYSSDKAVFAVAKQGGAPRSIMALAPKDYIFHLAVSRDGKNVIAGTGTPFTAIVLRAGDESPERYPFKYLNDVLIDGNDIFVAGSKDDSDGLYRLVGNTMLLAYANRCSAMTADASNVYCGFDSEIVAIDRKNWHARTLHALPPPWPESKVESIQGIGLDDTDVYFGVEAAIARVPKEG
ncbi:MAG: hypothetical protein ACRELY_22725, partial [Polyangiaceae bacterium]